MTKRELLFGALLIGLALPALASDSSESAALSFYRVGGVAAGGSLNVRTAPGLDAAIVGELTPDSLVSTTTECAVPGDGHCTNSIIVDGIEWVSVRGVGSDINGWIAARFLVALPPSSVDEGVIYFRVLEVAGADVFHREGDASPWGWIAFGDTVSSRGQSAFVDGVAMVFVQGRGGESTTGWVVASALEVVEPQAFDGTTLAIAGGCSGFEPYWGLSWNRDTVQIFDLFPSPDGEGRERTLSVDTISPTHSGMPDYLTATGEGVTASFLYFQGACEHLPLDRLAMDWGMLVTTLNGERHVVSGCCVAAPEAFAAAPQD